ncbi:hypothetical protein D9615_005810 [Tricholomella constricta]|uniref:RING-type domain-containing protein n=1 Tax=Tricholomella constricta TaxID=117010 RepID=A0A8H5M3V8_9AGAR|nr:hypothetical protein D9615_005810 [Tricholomella constricta]
MPKSQVGQRHVGAAASDSGIGNDPLPPPLTTRNLRPRQLKLKHKRRLQLQARASHRNACDRHINNPGPTMQSSAPSSSNAGSSSSRMQVQDVGGGGPSRAAKKKGRTVRGARTIPDSDSNSDSSCSDATSEDTDMVDQLISDDDDNSAYVPLSGSGTRSGRQISALASSSIQPPDGTTTPTLTPTTHVPVSSPSLRKILHPSNIEHFQDSSSTFASTSTSTSIPHIQDPPPAPAVASAPAGPPPPEPLSEYTCPICFFPPTHATLTPCGHICCGACLFAAVKSTMQRGALVRAGDMNVARCPVCRADIPGWDGKGGGVVGLRPRAVFSL